LTGWGAAVSLQGPAGDANVLYTDWVVPNNWTLVNGYGGQDIIEHAESVPAITADILGRGRGTVLW
jgi:hypothetical protein